MTISIQKAVNINSMNNIRVQGKNNHESARYKKNSRASQQQDNTPGKNNNKFPDGVQIFTSASVPEKPVVIDFTGIAEMNAVSLRFFLAMERQIVYFKLSGSDSENAC